MPTIEGYDQFEGVHWETGSVRNLFAQRGFSAPHSGAAYSEALLLGVSGGIVAGYFTFAYEGYDPQCNILTRNTFDPWDTMLSRLGVIQDMRQTRTSARAATILADTLAGGTPAIVWADRWSLPYNALSMDEGMWGSFPILVYGYEAEKDVVYVADRARIPLTLTVAELEAARSRIKKERFRLATLEAPDPDKLALAVQMGIFDTIRLFLEKPPKGSATNFGLKALQQWAHLLRQPGARTSWQKQFPPGAPLYAGLTSAYSFAFLFGKGEDEDAERTVYADFLEEAAQILDRPALVYVAGLFRASAAAWSRLPGLLLPDAVPSFAETRQLLLRRHRLFLKQGDDSRAERLAIGKQLQAIRDGMEDNFPLTQTEVEALRERLAAQIMAIHETERAAVLALQEAMAG